MPFFSIIIASYNAASVIESALSSLAAQSCRDFEVLIQDGASSDGTVAAAERFRHALPSLVVLSEQDAGVYDAWEKIIPRARGDWILFLGADDRLAGPHVLEQAKAALPGLGASIQFALGRLTYVTPEGVETASMFLYPEGMRAALPYGNLIGHAAVFHRRAFFATHHFDASFRILGDYDFFCKYWRDELAASIRVLVAKVTLGGLSNSETWMNATREENIAIRKRHFPRIYYLECGKAYLRNFPALVSLYRKLRALVISIGTPTEERGTPDAKKTPAAPAMKAAPKNMDSSPRVSVILPSYNYARHLREAVDSIRAQTHPHWELLIVDDGSRDDSVSIAEEYAARDERIRVLRHPNGANRGLAATVLLGLQHARHEIVAFLEADDAWEPESLAARLELMRQPGTALVFNAPCLIVEQQRNIGFYHWLVAILMVVIAKRQPPLVKARELLFTNLIPSFSCVMAARGLLLACDFMPPSPPLLDKWLWQQLSLRGACRFIPRELTRWRLHGQSYMATYTGDEAKEKRLWREKSRQLFAERTTLFQNPGLWLLLYFPGSHILWRIRMKWRLEGLPGILRAVRKRLP